MPTGLSYHIIRLRRPIIAIIFLFTVLFAIQLPKVSLDTHLQKMVPANHPYIQNLFKHIDQLSLGNDIRIAVAVKKGDIFQDDYLTVLKKVSDAAFYLPGADKAKVSSLWTPNVRWVEVTVDGFRGGAIIPEHFDGSPQSMTRLKKNVLRSGQVGRLVADDFKSTIIHVPLLDLKNEDDERIDYKAVSDALEKIRSDYENDEIEIRIIGFAKKMGDLIAGAKDVAIFFLIAIAITFLLLAKYLRCIVAAIMATLCSITAVIWQLGLLRLLGFGIDPYSMLVPFLVFAIGVSHAVQILNRFALEQLTEKNRQQAAVNTMKKLMLPGLIALLSDGIGFATLYMIELDVIRELALAASVGIFAIILTNLILLPIMLSMVGVHRHSITQAEHKLRDPHTIWLHLSQFSGPKKAPLAVLVGIVLALLGWWGSQSLKIGDLDRGAPELRVNSRYNQDVQYIADHYSVSADVLVVMVETPPQQCTAFPIMDTIDRFHSEIELLPVVESVVSLTTIAKLTFVGMNEGNIKWSALPRDQVALNYSVSRLPDGLMNLDCSLVSILVFLEDHKAETLQQVTHAVEVFSEQNNSDFGRFILASGNAGVEAATNDTIADSQTRMLVLIYAVVSLLCLISFRSWIAMFAIVIPLALTSLLCQAFMALLGIGVKVGTLPVIALGVGIGVDYGIYIYSRLTESLKTQASLQFAYWEALKYAGGPVMFTGVTLSIGVGTWVFSAIKYQADMGILLTFMFIWNMIGALVLLPAVTYFLRYIMIATKNKLRLG